MPTIQPVEPSREAAVITVSANSRGCTSRPPYSFGCSSRIAPDSRRICTALSSSLPRASLDGPRVKISYAVFCLKKKKQHLQTIPHHVTALQVQRGGG